MKPTEGPRVNFTKMTGSGNDFVVVDNRGGAVDEAGAGDLARSLCRHRLSVGADGLVLISTPADLPPGVAYRWRYVNADGSDGEMCGNGAMCGARFAVEHGIAPGDHTFITPSGPVHAIVDRETGRVSLDISDPGPVEPEVTVTVCGLALPCFRIEVGVPHVVTLAADADAFADAARFTGIGRAVRHHEAFAPAGTNLNVISRLSPGHWRMRTYERGVEAETLACGTGAVASALVLHARGEEQGPVRIRTSGGRDLEVSFTVDDGRYRNVRLTGHAAVVYAAELGPDALA